MKKNLEKKEKLLSLDREPIGKNDLSSRASFMQEKLYHQKAFSNIEFYMYTKPTDFYYDAPFYGRIDEDSFAISPKKESLVQIKQSEEIVKCQNFVRDAFNDFYSFWQNAKRNGILNEEGILYNLDFIEAYVDPEVIYSEYIQNQNMQFFDFIDSKGISKKIKDFKSFLKNWILFVDGKISLLPFTYSSFYLSKFSNQRTSGLMIDLSDDDKTDDNKKYNKYINDTNYLFFYNSILNFGFNVDKKIPWRIVANIDSEIMKSYMSNYNISNTKELYNKNYNKIFLNDLEKLKISLTDLYSDYISRDSFFVKPKIHACSKNGIKVESEIVLRDQKIKNLDEEILRVYLFLKARENNLDWDQTKFNNVYSKTAELYKNLDIDTAMRYAFRSLNVKSDLKIKNTLFSI